MKTVTEVAVRPLSAFSETESADDWLTLYQTTRSVEELLGLLHEGARYAEDSRVLDLYLSYAKFYKSDTDNDRIVLKARSMLYHHILRILKNGISIMVSADKCFDLMSEKSKKLAGLLYQVFQAFKSMWREAFPTQQPFQNDMYEFLEYCGDKLVYAAGTRGPGEPTDLWAKLVEVLIGALDSPLFLAERYDKLLRKLARFSDSARDSIHRAVGSSLVRTRPHRIVIGAALEPFEEERIKKGGNVRIKALLHYDIRNNVLWTT